MTLLSPFLLKLGNENIVSVWLTITGYSTLTEIRAHPSVASSLSWKCPRKLPISAHSVNPAARISLSRFHPDLGNAQGRTLAAMMMVTDAAATAAMAKKAAAMVMVMKAAAMAMKEAELEMKTAMAIE